MPHEFHRHALGSAGQGEIRGESFAQGVEIGIFAFRVHEFDLCLFQILAKPHHPREQSRKNAGTWLDFAWTQRPQCRHNVAVKRNNGLFVVLGG
ncbi:MAG: hypothetical protein ABSE62_14125 [Chthoniobacteraceae bacterium]